MDEVNSESKHESICKALCYIPPPHKQDPLMLHGQGRMAGQGWCWKNSKIYLVYWIDLISYLLWMVIPMLRHLINWILRLYWDICTHSSVEWCYTPKAASYHCSELVQINSLISKYGRKMYRYNINFFVSNKNLKKTNAISCLTPVSTVLYDCRLPGFFLFLLGNCSGFCETYYPIIIVNCKYSYIQTCLFY